MGFQRDRAAALCRPSRLDAHHPRLDGEVGEVDRAVAVLGAVEGQAHRDAARHFGGGKGDGRGGHGAPHVGVVDERAGGGGAAVGALAAVLRGAGKLSEAPPRQGLRAGRRTAPRPWRRHAVRFEDADEEEWVPEEITN